MVDHDMNDDNINHKYMHDAIKETWQNNLLMFGNGPPQWTADMSDDDLHNIVELKILTSSFSKNLRLHYNRKCTDDMIEHASVFKVNDMIELNSFFENVDI